MLSGDVIGVEVLPVNLLFMEMFFARLRRIVAGGGGAEAQAGLQHGDGVL